LLSRGLVSGAEAQQDEAEEALAPAPPVPQFLVDRPASLIALGLDRAACALRSGIHEGAFVKTRGKTIAGLPKHPFGIARDCGAP
jgi:hypothetical protein